MVKNLVKYRIKKFEFTEKTWIDTVVNLDFTSLYNHVQIPITILPTGGLNIGELGVIMAPPARGASRYQAGRSQYHVNYQTGEIFREDWLGNGRITIVGNMGGDFTPIEINYNL